WAGMMNQVHIGYTSWNDPPADVMPALVRGVAAPAPSQLAEDAAAPQEEVFAIPAAAFGQAEGAGRFEWTVIGMLGQWGAVPLALPQGQAPTSVEEGVFLEYEFRLAEAGAYTL